MTMHSGTLNNTKPANLGALVWNFIKTLIDAGYTVQASGDGLSAYSSSATVFSNLGATTNTINTKIGTPVSSVSADIAEVEAETDDIAAIKTATDLLGTPSGGRTFAYKIDEIEGTTNNRGTS